jgi:hypothetical protein
MARPRQTACAYGHPLGSPGNTRYNRNGSAECQACHRRRCRDWQRQHRASQPIVDDKQVQAATIALVVWRPQPREYSATWTYHATYAEAAAAAPADLPFTIVDIARKPWVHPLSVGKGTLMHPKQLARLQAAAAANDKQMRPHPQGLAGRCQDALDDLELVTADPNATLEAKRSAQALAAAMVRALAAET